MKNAVIIGAGITGLTTAYTLKRAGWNVRVFEKSAQAGGAIRTVKRDGYTVETGPNSLMVASLKTTLLLGELGLSDEVLLPEAAAKNRFILKGGEMVPVPNGAGKFLKTNLLSTGAKLRLLKEPFVKKPSNLAEESLANFVERRLGEEVLNFMAEPLVAGIFAGDPKRLSAQHAFPQVAAMEEAHGSLIKGAMHARKGKPAGSHKAVMTSFKNGMQSLTDALAARLGESLSYHSTVTAITHEGGNWQVSWESNGQAETLDTDAVIIATPAFAVRELPLPREIHETLYDLHEIHYPPLTSFSVGYRREQIQHAMDGFGVLVPAVENRDVLGVLFPSSIFAGRAPESHALLTVFLGGMRQPDLAMLPEGEQLALIKCDLADMIGASGEPVFTERTVWPKAIPQYHLGHGDYLRMIEKAEQVASGLHLCGNYRGGISVGQCLNNGVALAQKIAN